MTTQDPPPTVLVVDDDEDVIETYKFWLDDEYDLRTATSGQEALEQLEAAVDVVLLDRLMPGLSGEEVLEEIRASGFDCRVAMATAIEPDPSIVEMPFDAYVTKALDYEEVQETIERLLARSEYDETVREHYAVAEKLATLEDQHPDDKLADSEEYQRLRERFEELDEQVTDHGATVTHDDLVGSLSDLERAAGAADEGGTAEATDADPGDADSTDADSTDADSAETDTYALLDGQQETRAVPTGTTLLVLAPSSAGRRFVIESLEVGLSDDEAGLVITTNETAAAIIGDLEAVDAPTDRFRIVDCQTDTTGTTGDPIIVQDVDTPRDLTDIGIGFTNALDEFDEMNTERGRCGLLSLTNLLSYVDQETAYRFCQTLTRGLDDEEFLGLFLLDRQAHDTQTVSTLQRAVDGIVDIESTDDGYDLRIRDIEGVSSDPIPLET